MLGAGVPPTVPTVPAMDGSPVFGVLVFAVAACLLVVVWAAFARWDGKAHADVQRQESHDRGRIDEAA